MAAILGVTQVRISQIEIGREPIPKKLLTQLQKTFGLRWMPDILEYEKLVMLREEISVLLEKLDTKELIKLKKNLLK